MSFSNLFKGRVRSAFTLIELLIVVAIIAILAAIAVPNFLEAQVRSKVSRVKADMRTVATALESYLVDTNKYPPSGANVSGTVRNSPVTVGGIDGVATPMSPAAGGVGRIERLTWLTTPISYITSIPRDPFSPGESDAIQDQQNPVFVYWDAPYTDRLKLASPASFLGPPASGWEDMPNQLSVSGSWTLASYGPDRLFNVAGGSPLRLYNPTNGTVSAGDVWRFSSGIPNE